MLGKNGYSQFSEAQQEKLEEFQWLANEYPNSKGRVQVYLYNPELYEFTLFCMKNKLSKSEFASQLILQGMRNFKKPKPKKQTTKKFVQESLFEGEE